MEQNIAKCKECIKKLKKKFEENRFNILKVNDNILLKISTDSLNTSINTSVSNVNKICPINPAGCIHDNHSCTHSGNCHIDHSKCPICGNNNGNNTSGIPSDIQKERLSLFRIRPTDTYNGIFLHAIILYGEECDLKMTFGYDDESISQIIETIKFLI